jgi:DNA polymerase III delta prime subunit
MESILTMIMSLLFPPPHYILFEPLNDTQTLQIWNAYKFEHSSSCEFEVVDAAKLNSVDTFTPFFEGWITRKCSKRFRVLLVLHSEFLTFSCQQVLRRSLEQRSFRCRVWFHVEDPTQLQPAIISRCVTKRIDSDINNPRIEVL